MRQYGQLKGRKVSFQSKMVFANLNLLAEQFQQGKKIPYWEGRKDKTYSVASLIIPETSSCSWDNVYRGSPDGEYYMAQASKSLKKISGQECTERRKLNMF